MQTPGIDFDDFLKWSADDNIKNQLTARQNNQISPKFNTSCYEDKFLDELNKFRLEDKYTDVRIICQGTEFPAHKMILASGSGYFHDLFAQKKIGKPVVDVIELDEIEANTLNLVITYLYTGKLNFTSMTPLMFKRFMQGINFLKISAVERIFLDYLINRISPLNYNYILQLASNVQDDKAEEHVIKYLTRNIETVWLQSEFLTLSEEHLVKVFKSISQTFKSHDLLLLIFLMLIENSPNKYSFSVLHSFIDFKKVSISWGKDIFSYEDGLNKFNPHIKIYNNPNAMKDVLRTAVLEYKRKTNENQHADFSRNNFIIPRLRNNSSDDAILIIVGLDRANRTICSNYSFIKGTWSEVEDTGMSMEFNPGVGLYDDKIYFIGGEDIFGNKMTTANYYDLETKKLEHLPNLSVPRAEPAVCRYKNEILVAGGIGRYGFEGITVVETIDSSSKKWIMGQPLRVKRGKNCHGLEFNDKSIVVGGGSLQVECFNWKTRVWLKSDPLPGTVDETFLYALGEDKLYAYKDYKPDTIYELDFESLKWSWFKVKGILPECVVCTVGWKSYIFATNSSRIVYMLNLKTKNWNKNCKLPRQMVRAIYMGLAKESL